MCTKLEELVDETDLKGFDVEFNVREHTLYGYCVIICFADNLL